MSRLESLKNLLGRWFSSIPFFVLLSLVLGVVIAILAIPRPKVAIVPIDGVILDQAYTNSILEALKKAGDDRSIRAVVLQIDSPGGGASVVEQIYLDILRLRERKPVIGSIGSMAASGGYYIAAASESIYAPPTAQVGSIGVISSLPAPEDISEDIIASGLFKSTGSSKRQILEELEVVRQQFVNAVMSQRGQRLKLSSEELSLARLYSGVEGLKVGLIDEIGTVTSATKRAASLGGIRNYVVEKLFVQQSFSFFFFGPSGLANLKSQARSTPTYYYLAFESE